MDCNTAIVYLTSAHVVTMGIFAGYRIIVNRQFIKFEKEKKAQDEKIVNLERQINILSTNKQK